MRSPLAALGAIVAALGVAVAPSGGTAQPRVTVRAETRIELTTSRTPEGVRIAGVLRDDLGDPLAGEGVTLRVSGADGGRASAARPVVLTTAVDGTFATTLPLVTGRYRLDAEYESGDGLHGDVEVSRDLDLTRADVQLVVELPGGPRVDLDRPRHEVAVSARSAEGGDGLEVEAHDELGRTLARARTDARGEARLLLESRELAGPGPGRILVVAAEDARRARSVTEVPVVRSRRTQLVLDAEAGRVAPEEPLQLRGRLSDSAGGIEGRAIGLFGGGQHVGTVLTDADGAFALAVRLPGPEGSAVELVGRFESDFPGRESSESAPLRVELVPTPSPSVGWLLLPFLCCGLVLLWLRRRDATRQAAPEAARPAPAAAGVVRAPRTSLRPADHVVAGRVVDHRDGEPIATAVVSLLGSGSGGGGLPVGAQGDFQSPPLPAGRWILRVEARGFEPAEAAFDLPHRGELRGMMVRIESLRGRAQAAFREVAVRVLEDDRSWAVLTEREVAAHAPEGLDVEGLASRVERAAYDERPPSRAEVEEIARAAQATAQALGSPEEPR